MGDKFTTKATSCCRSEVDTTLIQKATAYINEHEERIKERSQLFSLLGNEVRLKIVMLFLEYPRMCVCDLSDVLAMKQSPISQHLRKLKDGGILDNVREGMTIYYFLTPHYRKHLQFIVEL